MAAIARSAQRGLAGRRVISGHARLPCVICKEKPFTLAPDLPICRIAKPRGADLLVLSSERLTRQEIMRRLNPHSKQGTEK
jgi:hypothetical protein